MRCRREIKPSEVGGFRFLSANAGDRGSGAKIAPAVPSETTQLLLQCSPGHADTPASLGLGFVSRRILQPIGQEVVPVPIRIVTGTDPPLLN